MTDVLMSQARKYAAAMKAPLIFCSVGSTSSLGGSSSNTINVQKAFKIVLSKVWTCSL